MVENSTNVSLEQRLRESRLRREVVAPPSVTAELVDRTKLKGINGFDGTILEERSGEGSSALGSGRNPSSIQEANSAGQNDDQQEGDDEAECDFMDEEEDCDERPEAPFRHLPESLHLKS